MLHPESPPKVFFSPIKRRFSFVKRKWGFGSRVPSGAPPAGLSALLSCDPQLREDRFLPCAHLRLLGAFVQMVIAQQVKHGMGH